MNVEAKAYGLNKEATKGIIAKNKIATKDRLKKRSVERHSL
jgi:hypothetical protein